MILFISHWSDILAVTFQQLISQEIFREKILVSHEHFSITYNFNRKIFCEKSASVLFLMLEYPLF